MASASTDRRHGLTADKGFKAPCVCATTVNVTLSGEQTIDGVLTSANRVLVKNQTDTTQNGLYDTSSAAWTRSIDSNGNYDLVNGVQVLVTGGTQAYTVWVLNATNPITIGTSSITFSQSLSTGFLATLAGSAGSSLIGFSQSGGATTTLQVRGRNVTWSSDYGHLPSASAAVNDAAMVAAVTAVNGAGGGTVMIGPGTYQHSSISIDATSFPNVNIVGSGKAKTILKKNDATTTPVLSIVATGLVQTYSTLSDFSIVGLAGSPGLRTTLLAIFTVRNVAITTCTIGWDNVGSLIASVYDTDLQGNATGYKATRTGGIYPNLIAFYGGQCIGNTAIGYDIVHGHGITWDHVDIEMNGVTANAATGGVFIRSTTNLEISYGTFSFDNCWFEQNMGPNLTVEAAAGILLTVKDTKFIRGILANSAVAMSIGAIECANLYNNLAISVLAGNLTTTIAASRSNVEGGLYGVLTNTSTGYQHRQVGTAAAFIPFVAGDSSGNVATIGPQTADFPNATIANVGGTQITKRYTVPATGNVTTTIPVATVAQLGGVMAFVRGADNATGIAYARVYLVAIKINGGGGADIAQVSGTFAGNATPTFTFSNSGGFLRVANDNANPGYVSFFGV